MLSSPLQSANVLGDIVTDSTDTRCIESLRKLHENGRSLEMQELCSNIWPWRNLFLYVTMWPGYERYVNVSEIEGVRSSPKAQTLHYNNLKTHSQMLWPLWVTWNLAPQLRHFLYREAKQEPMHVKITNALASGSSHSSMIRLLQSFACFVFLAWP